VYYAQRERKREREREQERQREERKREREMEGRMDKKLVYIGNVRRVLNAYAFINFFIKCIHMHTYAMHTHEYTGMHTEAHTHRTRGACLNAYTSGT
jgi:hypothetical protein